MMGQLRLASLLLAVLLGSCAASWLQFQSLPQDGSQAETATGLLRIPPGGGRYPAIVMLPDCNGIDPHERRWGRELAEAGYVTYVVDSHFTRQVTDGCADPLPTQTLVADALGAIKRLSEREEVDPTRLAVIGWGRGGDIALSLVASGDLLPQTEGIRAVVAFYPTCEAAGPVSRPVTLVLPELYPDAQRCTAYADALAGEGEEPVRYLAPDGVGAGFDCEVCGSGDGVDATYVYDAAVADRVRETLFEQLSDFLGPKQAP